jgi:hypothetical protein
MNPFGVVDVLAPDWTDVQMFAATVNLAGDSSDANASPWPAAQPGDPLDGEWAGRWSDGSTEDNWAVGTATIRTVGDRVYILFQQMGYGYLIDARKQGDSYLVGKYLNLQDHRDSYPWVGLIVNNERIDGAWTGGRWDFRRQRERG